MAYLGAGRYSATINASVKDMVDEFGQWRWHLFEHLIPTPIFLQIAAMKAPFGIRVPYQVCWGVNSNKWFSVRSDYEVREGSRHGPTEQIWRTINRFKGLPRIRYFLWLLSHGLILTNVGRYRRHLTLDCRCSVCGDEWEDMDHIFRRCPVACSVWDTLIRADKKGEIYSMDFKRWLFVNLSNSGGFCRDHVHWDILFGSLLWCLWKKRNELIFGGPDRYGESVLQRGLLLFARVMLRCSCGRRFLLLCAGANPHQAGASSMWMVRLVVLPVWRLVVEWFVMRKGLGLFRSVTLVDNRDSLLIVPSIIYYIAELLTRAWNLVWNIGDGSQARFWLDPWLGNGDPIVAYLGTGRYPATINVSVKDMVDEFGQWRWHLFEHLIPTPIFLQIAAMKTPFGIRVPYQLQEAVSGTVCWCKPPPGWCKLNVDGSIGRATGMAACGGVVRNEEGTWLIGLFRSVTLVDNRDSLLIVPSIIYYIAELLTRAWNLVWNIGDGSQARFWLDPWLGNGDPIVAYLGAGRYPATINASFKDMVDEFGQWRWHLFEHLIPTPIFLQIAAMKVPFGIRVPYQVCWGVNSNKWFSVRSDYEVREGSRHGPTEQIWRTINRFKGLPRIRYFLWLLSHGLILTNVGRYRRHLTLDCRCSVCGDEWEDMDHIFRRCPVACSVWDTLIRADKKGEIYSMDFKRWLFVNLSNSRGFCRDHVHWDILFGSLLWCLWKKRNEWIFGGPDRYGESVLQRGLLLFARVMLRCSCGRRFLLLCAGANPHQAGASSMWMVRLVVLPVWRLVVEWFVMRKGLG
ncbi:hypothetical protein V6N12_073595 [Hibiscus sabdariffa]|uniref:Reverse transcriptase zinc-binding domain-containing protein n=1 Tax=Hibiscus sabdariffa TaxID=183260 RepID=A0ABR2BHL3_9ROSI